MSTLSDITTHTRAGNATMVDSDGLLKWAPHNLFTYANSFVTTGAGAWLAPEGTTLTGGVSGFEVDTLATNLVPTATNTGTHRIRRDNNSATTKRQTYGVIAKANGYSQIGLREAATTGATAVFDLSDGTVVNTFNSGNFTVEATTPVSLGDGWYYVSMTLTDAGATVQRLAIHATSGYVSGDVGSTVFTGDGVSGVLISASRSINANLPMVDNPDRSDSYVPTTASAVYLPRTGHHLWDGSAWVDEGYFHESEARTNLIAYSDDFTDAYWTNAGLTVSGSDLTPTAVSGLHSLARTIVGTATTYTVYYDVEANGYDWVGLYITYDFNSTIYCAYNVSTGTKNTPTVTASMTGDSKIVDLGGGVYRCILTITDPGIKNPYILLQPLTASATSRATYTGDGVSGITVHGAQLEEGSTPSSYIPTAGSTVTRAAETLTVPTANAPWNPLAVSIQMEGTMTYADTDANDVIKFFNWELDGNNFIYSTLDTNGAQTGEVDFRQNVSGTADIVGTAGTFYSPGINVPFNIASRHGSTFLNGAVDGTALTADTTPVALPDLSATDIDIATTFMGTIKLFRVWSDDITDAGIAEASA